MCDTLLAPYLDGFFLIDNSLGLALVLKYLVGANTKDPKATIKNTPSVWTSILVSPGVIHTVTLHSSMQCNGMGYAWGKCSATEWVTPVVNAV